ncbi:MAG: hypothetical protein ABWY05_08185, partial [Noviherbaspirillum sp.]
AAYRTRGSQQHTSTGVNLLIVTHTNPNQSKCEICTKLLATLNYIGPLRCFKENTCFGAQLTCMSAAARTGVVNFSEQFQ